MKKLLLPFLLCLAACTEKPEEQSPQSTYSLALSIINAGTMAFAECPNPNGLPTNEYDGFICAQAPFSIEETLAAIDDFQQPETPWTYKAPSGESGASYSATFFLPTEEGEKAGDYVSVVIQEDGLVLMHASDYFE